MLARYVWLGTSSFISCLLANPVPKRTQQGYAVGSSISSTGWFQTSDSPNKVQFKRASEVCKWFFENWSRNELIAARHAGFEDSEFVTANYAEPQIDLNRVEFQCVDIENDRSISKGDNIPGEVPSLGPFYLQCDMHTERPVTWPEPAVSYGKRSTRNYFNGGCKTKDELNEERSTKVAAGDTACLEMASSSSVANVESYVSRDDPAAWFDQSIQPFSDWLNIAQLGTTRQTYVEKQDVAVLKVDTTRSNKYRACVKLSSGHGNGIFHLIST